MTEYFKYPAICTGSRVCRLVLWWIGICIPYYIAYLMDDDHTRQNTSHDCLEKWNIYIYIFYGKQNSWLHHEKVCLESKEYTLLIIIIWVHKTSLKSVTSLMIEVPIPNQQSERSCIYVSILPISSIVYWSLELFRLCGTFLFCFSYNH